MDGPSEALASDGRPRFALPAGIAPGRSARAEVLIVLKVFNRHRLDRVGQFEPEDA